MDSGKTTDDETSFGEKFVLSIVSSKKSRVLAMGLFCLCLVILAISVPIAAQSVSDDQSQSHSSGPADISTEVSQIQLEQLAHRSAEIGVRGYAQARDGSNNTSEDSSGKENNSSEEGDDSGVFNDLGSAGGHYVDMIKHEGDAGWKLLHGNISGTKNELGNASNSAGKVFEDVAAAGGQAKKDVGNAKDAAVNKTEDLLPSGFGISYDIATGWYNITRDRAINITNDLAWISISNPAPGEPMKPGTWYPGYASPVNSSKVNSSYNNSVGGNNSTYGDVPPLGPPGTTPASRIPDFIQLEQFWKASWDLYAGLTLLAIPILLILGTFAWAQPGRKRERDKRLQDVFISSMLVIFGTVIMPGLLHGSNLLAFGIMPHGLELFSTPGNLLKMGLGAAFLYSGVVILCMFFTLIQWLAAFFIAALWPIYAGLWASSSQTAKAYSKLGFSMLGFLIGVRLVQALLLRLLWELPLGLTAPLQSFLALIITIIGLLAVFVGIPFYATIKLVPSFIVNIGKTGGRVLIYR